MRYELTGVDRFSAVIALRSAGLRATLPRLAILAILTQRFCMTPAELTRELAVYQISHTTIYRSLAALKKANLVHDVARRGKAQVELTQRLGRHTHSMYCTRCKWVRVFQNQQIERTIKQIVAQCGLATATHEITMRGICRKCRN